VSDSGDPIVIGPAAENPNAVDTHKSGDPDHHRDSTVVTASGSVTEPTAVEQALIQAVTGAVVGGICTLLVGLIKRGIDEHKSGG